MNNHHPEQATLASLSELIEAAAQQYPEQQAVRLADKAISYQALNQRANQCARYLIDMGAGAGVAVGIVMDRSIDMVVALLAVLKARSAYLPIDVNDPKDRRDFIIEDADIGLLLTQQQFADELADFDGTFVCLDDSDALLSSYSFDNISQTPKADDIAYIIYTSGSTGKPKGCLVHHKAICNRLVWMAQHYGVNAKDNVLQKTPVTFDVSVWELFLPLIAGATLVMAKPGGHRDPSYLSRSICEYQITLCHFVPSMLQHFLSQAKADELTSLRHVFVSGEALSFELVKGFMGLCRADLNNLYGPTEAAVDVSFYRCELREDKKVPIGKAIDNVDLHILDEQLKPVDKGHSGQLCIGGVAVAKGYLNRPELSAQKFVNDPFNLGGKLYLTGDLAKELEDGNIEYLGRSDFQVKLRGFRIELPEIESALLSHNAVEQAVVLVQDKDSIDPKLVAYVAGQALPEQKQLKHFLEQSLPAHMVPNLIVSLDSMPVTKHGKADRGALPWPVKRTQLAPAAALSQQQTAQEQTTPEQTIPEQPLLQAADEPMKANSQSTPSSHTTASIGQDVLHIFIELLGRDTLALEDDLFDFGATSFTMIQAVDKINQRFNIEVPVDIFLQEPRIYAIAQYIFDALPQKAKASGGSSAHEAAQLEYRPITGVQTKSVSLEPSAMLDVQDINLQQPDFADKFYLNRQQSRSFSATCQFIGELLSLYKAAVINQECKYLYGSAGGLNPIQCYLHVKANRCPGLPGGVYYYHPLEHALYLVGDNVLDSAWFGDEALFERAAVTLFYVARLDVIVPKYQSLSATLSILEAGYMAQLLAGRQHEFGQRAIPLGIAKGDKLQQGLGLNDKQLLTYALAIDGLVSHSSVNSAVNTGADAKRIFAGFKAYEQQNQQQFKQLMQSPPSVIEPFGPEVAKVTLCERVWHDNYYIVRGAKRFYQQSPVSFARFSQFMALLCGKTDSEGSHYLYQAAQHSPVTSVYVYLRKGAVEGIAAGVYRFERESHRLVWLASKLSGDLKSCHMPFNRKHAQQAKFCLFLMADIDSRSDDTQAKRHQALIEAGYIGQLLMDRQQEFDIGVCPIGGMKFDNIRESFRLNSSQELIHSFVCGGFDLSLYQSSDVPVNLPASWPYLDGRAVAADTAVTLPQTDLTLLRQPSAQQSPSKLDEQLSDIAIVGMACRFAGSDNPQQLWHNLATGKSHFSRLGFDSPQGYRHKRSSHDEAGHFGGFIADIDSFDSLLFKISPAEAQSMDPQERKLLEVVYESIEHSGYCPSRLSQSGEVGVYVGAMWDDYQHHASDGLLAGVNIPAVSHHSSIANRISYYFDFAGPSVALNTSCSSAMSALHMALGGLKAGECSTAIVGGVNLLSHPYHFDMLKGMGLLSTGGMASPFGSQSSGWIAGEGVGALVLKSKAAAIQDGDSIYGLIKGSSINHSGKAVRYSAPNSQRQTEGMLKALKSAKLEPKDIDYIEAAAAGAAMADAAEFSAIKAVFNPATTEGKTIAIGSVKATLGHLESASSLSQLFKVLLQFNHQAIAPTLNTEPLNPLIKLKGSGLEIVTQLTPWPPQDRPQNAPQRALINAFGATGAGGHLVVESFTDPRQSEQTQQACIICLSAQSDEQLVQLAQSQIETLSSNQYALANIGYTLAVGRDAFAARAAWVVESTEQLTEALNCFVKGQDHVAQCKVDAHSNEPLRAKATSWLKAECSLDDIAQTYVGNNGSENCAKHLKRVGLAGYPFAKDKHWVQALSDAHIQPAKIQAAKQPVIQAQPELIDVPQAVVSQLSETPPAATYSENVVNVLSAHLKQRFSEVSQVPMSRLTGDVLFADYGINSAMIVSLNQLLEQDFGELSKTLFFEHHSVAELCTHLLNHHQNAVKQKLGIADITLLKSELGSDPIKSKNDLVSDPLRSAGVAIIGMAGTYPGAEDLAGFWLNLANGVDCISEIPKDRWDIARFYDQNGGEGKIITNWGGFITDVDKFDAPFFNISPKQAPFMDPQERLFLQTAWHTLEDAGYHRQSCAQSFAAKVGVFVGVMYGEYQLYSPSNRLTADGIAVGSSYGSIANRVSYFFDFSGPSMAVDTLCSSSLTALHLAVNALNNGECEAAIAGGVSLSIHPNKYIMASQLSMPSSDGRCRSFGAGGDGFIPGEGVGALLLRPVAKAKAAGDRIYGVIRATAVNHDGRTHGYTVPNPKAQARMIVDAIERAGVSPEHISYIEAHGTGTLLGDPVEINALTSAFSQYTSNKQFCAVGSVKSNIGHLESAAGVAGVSKILLQLRHKKRVPSLHSSELNPNIDFANSPFYIQQTLSDWPRPTANVEGILQELPRIACISGFGAGGANAHAIIEEYIAEQDEVVVAEPRLICLSAINQDRLAAYGAKLLAQINGYVEHPSEQQNQLLADIAYTSQLGRAPMAVRLAVVADSMASLKEKLEAFVTGSVTGNKNIPQLYFADGKQDSSSLQILSEDELLREAIGRWVEHKRLNQIAELWVKGMAVDWQKLYVDGYQPKRTEMALYPFAKQRYWLDPIKAVEAAPLTPSVELALQSAQSQTQAQAQVQALIQATGQYQPGPLAKPSGIVLSSLSVETHRQSAPMAATIQSQAPQTPQATEAPVHTQNVQDSQIAVQLFDYGNGVYCIKWAQGAPANRLNASATEQFLHNLAALEQKDEVKALLVMGASDGFISNEVFDEEACFASQLPLKLLECEVPVIAVSPGNATGLGWLLASVCDFMVLSDSGQYGGFNAASPWAFDECAKALFELRFGEQAARALLTPNKTVTGNELVALGQTMPVVAKDAVEATALALAYNLAERQKQSVSLLKRHLVKPISEALKRLLNSLTPADGAMLSVDEQAFKPFVRFNPWQAYIDNTAATAAASAGQVRQIASGCDVLELYEYPNGVVLAKLCDSQSKNLFTEQYVKGLTLAYEHVKQSPQAKVLILTGYDHYFACGGSKEGLLTIQKGDAKYSDSPLYEYPLLCDIPVIAAMQGHAIGAGWSMGMYCDIELMSEQSVYTTRFMRYGFTPGFGSTLIFPHKLGQDLGRELLFSAKELKGAELKARGIQTKVLNRDSLVDFALNLASALAERPKSELVATKQQAIAALKQRLKGTVSAELAMHDATFIGNSEALSIIEQDFQQGLETSSDTAAPQQNVQAAQAAGEFPLPSDEAARLEAMIARLKETLADELFVEIDELDIDVQFVDLGLDSITGATWMQTINRDFALSLTPTKVYNYPTVREFAAYVLGELNQQTPTATASGDEQPATASTTQATLKEPLAQSQRLPSQPLKMQLVDVEHSIVVPGVLSGSVAGSVAGASRDQVQMDSKPEREPATQEVSVQQDAVVVTKPQPALQPVPQPAPKAAPNDNRIAVIGMAGQFPGADNLAQFWQNLIDGVDSVGEIAKSRWDNSLYFDPQPMSEGKTYSKWMGALNDIDSFDADFFKLPTSEVAAMDPQQRLFLQNCWHCIEDAGITPKALSGTRCGVFVGCGTSDYVPEGQQAGLGGATSTLVGRISYMLNLQGPGMAIETACSSSLVAINSACDALVLDNCDSALAGGVFVMTGPAMQLVTSQAGMLSHSGRCYAFDQKADGFVLSEGVGVVLLKRLADAERDGDPIHGVIVGWGVNQDGKSNGITAPSPQAQQRLVKSVLDKFAINPEHIALVETHGTGTALGDPIEIEGLSNAYAGMTNKRNYCALGAVKANIGHSLMAAGVASVLKVLLCLKHQTLPPVAHFTTPNKHLELDSSPFYINTESQPWPASNGHKRMAAASAMGLSGTNAHIVIEEYVAQASKDKQSDKPLVVLSAKSPQALRAYANSLKAFVGANKAQLSLRDLAYTLQTGREGYNCRLVVVADSLDGLEQKLGQYIAAATTDTAWPSASTKLVDVYFGTTDDGKEKLSLLSGDDDLSGLIQSWVSKGKYAQLAGLWLAGFKLDWQMLYSEVPKRISAPGYPFMDSKLASKAGKRVKPAKAQQVVDSGLSNTEQYLAHLVAPMVQQNALELDIQQRFFELGVSSVDIVRLVEQLEQRFATKLSSTLLFEHSSIAALGEYLDTHFAASTELLSQHLVSHHSVSDQPINNQPISNQPASTQPQNYNNGDDLSYVQKLFVNLNRQYPRSHVHTILLKFKNLLPKAWTEQLAERLLSASALVRSVYDHNDKRIEVSGISAKSIVREHDFSHLARSAKEKALIVLNMDAFDLAKELPVRLNVIKWADNQSILALSIHHVAYDAFSLSRLLQSLVTGVMDHEDYRQFNVIEQQYLASPAAKEAEHYWQQRLSGSNIRFSCHTQYQRKATGAQGAKNSEYERFTSEYEPLLVREVSFNYPGELASKAKAYCHKQGISEPGLLQYVYMASLMALGDMSDLVMGTLLSYPRTRESEKILGPLLNVSFSRLQAESLSHRERLEGFDKQLKQQFGHHLYPMQKVLEAQLNHWQLTPQGLSIYLPVMFNYLGDNISQMLSNEVQSVALDGMQAEFYSPAFLKEISGAQVYLFASMNEQGIAGKLWINDAKYNQQLEQALIDKMRSLLTKLVETQPVQSAQPSINKGNGKARPTVQQKRDI